MRRTCGGGEGEACQRRRAALILLRNGREQRTIIRGDGGDDARVDHKLISRLQLRVAVRALTLVSCGRRHPLKDALAAEVVAAQRRHGLVEEAHANSALGEKVRGRDA